MTETVEKRSTYIAIPKTGMKFEIIRSHGKSYMKSMHIVDRNEVLIRMGAAFTHIVARRKKTVLDQCGKDTLHLAAMNTSSSSRL